MLCDSKHLVFSQATQSDAIFKRDHIRRQQVLTGSGVQKPERRAIAQDDPARGRHLYGSGICETFQRP